MKKILLLGSGELGKEFVIAAQRLGQTVVACDKYAGAPAMQVADAFEVFDMLDGDALAAAVAKHRPDVIVPEIEAIRTERLYDFERAGVQVAPSARAVNFTMNRKAIRDLAAKELGLKTARYFYAASLGELREAASGRSVKVLSSQPSVMIYTGNWLAGGCPETKTGGRYADYDGVAIECQGFPDAPNRPDFPSAELRPGEAYRRTIRFRFAVR